LFIHGNSSCKEVFGNQLGDGIGADCRCLLMDLPGHGQSGDAHDPAATYHMAGYADAALQAISALHDGPFFIVGWSLGGHIGIELLTLTDRIQGLVISGTPAVGRDAADMATAFLPNPHMVFSGRESLSEEEMDAYAHTTCGDRHYVDFLGEAVRRTDGRARRIMMESAISGAGANQKQIVETNTTPLAVINGNEEALVNNEYVTSLNYANLWRDQVFLLDEAGHAPFWDKPNEFNALLHDFLSECIAAG
ncbi:MAG: alpha/beta hydrolase, partial [SAR86 cluster bacterium]|nr:alpha/beta hydrolase [SAR86 cluster bacterium]